MLLEAKQKEAKVVWEFGELKSGVDGVKGTKVTNCTLVGRTM